MGRKKKYWFAYPRFPKCDIPVGNRRWIWDVARLASRINLEGMWGIQFYGNDGWTIYRAIHVLRVGYRYATKDRAQVR